MAAVDLLPWREHQRRRRGGWRLGTVAALLLASVGAMVSRSGELRQQQQMLAVRLAQEQQQTERLEAGLASLKDLEARHAAAQAQHRKLIAWQTEHGALAHLLPALGDALPDGAVLQRISVQQGSVALSGEVEDSAVLPVLGNALSAMLVIEQLSLDEAGRKTVVPASEAMSEAPVRSAPAWRTFRLQGRIAADGVTVPPDPAGPHAWDGQRTSGART